MPKSIESGLVKDWEDLARDDPLWDVASHPGRRRNDPDAWNRKAFLETGKEEVELIRNLLGITSFSDKTFLEVGCGAGRLSYALARGGAWVIGIDISYRMLALAKNHTAKFAKRVALIQGNGRDLSMVTTACCDIALSWHVMQHIPDSQMVMFLLAEIWRVLREGGIACIHIPQRSAKNVRWRLYKVLSRLGLTLNPTGSLTAIPMFGINKVSVINECKAIGFQLIRVVEHNLNSAYYILSK